MTAFKETTCECLAGSGRAYRRFSRLSSNEQFFNGVRFPSLGGANQRRRRGEINGLISQDEFYSPQILGVAETMLIQGSVIATQRVEEQ